MENDLPLVSIITVCLNARSTLRRAIGSIQKQSYKNIEYLVIDGGSTDGTLAILAEFEDLIEVLVSEPDSGISAAFNKGIALAQGKYIQLLNADDVLSGNKIAKSVELLERNPAAAFAFGDLITLNSLGTSIMRVKGDPNYSRGMGYLIPLINHVTFLVPRTSYEKYGVYDPTWKLAMDYDWVLRGYHRGARGIYSSEILVYMQEGGASSDWRSAFKEVWRINCRNGMKPWLARGAFYFAYGKFATRLLFETLFSFRLVAYFRPGKKLLQPSNSVYMGMEPVPSSRLRLQKS